MRLDRERTIDSPTEKLLMNVAAFADELEREILLRTLYRGKVVWSRKQKRDRWGVKKYLDRPECEWIRPRRACGPSSTRSRAATPPTPSVRELLEKDIPRTRQILRRRLVGGRLECQAFDERQRVGYRFKALGSYAALLPAGFSTPEMVTPAGFYPGGMRQVRGIMRVA